jgi:hypothetical protein
MKTFLLTARNHEEFGDIGIYMKTGRDYFQPAMGGMQLAHDILEHPATPHPNGYTDELMAIGGLLAGRIRHRWTTKHGRTVDVGDIASDISNLTTSSLYEDEPLCPKKCSARLRNPEDLHFIRKAVTDGLIEGIEEYEDHSYGKIPDHHNFDVDSIVGWICKGHQLFRRRFAGNTFDVSTYFFDRISHLGDEWLKSAEEGDTATLRVDFSGVSANLETEYQ